MALKIRDTLINHCTFQPQDYARKGPRLSHEADHVMSTGSDDVGCGCSGAGSCSDTVGSEYGGGGSSSNTVGGCCGGDGSCECQGRTDRSWDAFDALRGDDGMQPGDFEESSSMPDLGLYWTVDDLDDDWERDAREYLDDVEFDTELGIELARDALKLARGELSESTFQQRHHDAIMEEFGIDERIVESVSFESVSTSPSSELPSGSPRPRVPESPTPALTSRRNVLKSMGGLAAAGSMAGLAGCLDGDTLGAEAGPPAGDVEEGDVQMGMVIDMERCIACLKCVEGCKEENDTDRGTHWMHVFRFEDPDYDEDREGYLPRPCQHCSAPSCAYVCPTHARFKRAEDGLVLTNYDTCIGCKYCQVACPYGVNFLGTGESTDKSSGFFGDDTDDDGVRTGGPPDPGVMGKCTFCSHRQDDAVQAGTTACEDACPVDAIHFGDMHDSESQPRSYLRDNDEESRFRLLDQLGNKPNIVYLGDEPSSSARPIEGPFTYEDLGMEKLADPEVPGE